MAKGDFNPVDAVRRPGFGQPLNYAPPDKDLLVPGTFPIALGFENEMATLRLTTLREFAMMRFMNSVTDKPEWDRKVFDLEIVAKWRQEVLSSAEDFTEAMFAWCIAELQHKTSAFRETGFIAVYNADVVKSDTAIPSAIKTALREAVKPLEDVPKHKQDWHPGSDGKVLDLVHPSLFPLVYSRSRALPDRLVKLDECLELAGKGVVVPRPRERPVTGRMSAVRVSEFSEKFQWLPCEIEWDDAKKSRIKSYINNLHPTKHQGLYGIIEDLVDAAIPLWDATLTRDDHRRPRIPYDSVQYSPDPDSVGPRDPDYPKEEPGEDSRAYFDRVEAWRAHIMSVAQLVIPEPGTFDAELRSRSDYPSETVDLKQDYEGLQIIVKLANIVLTPEKPEYEGGTWHVEGQMNEHIVATALYYYDSENITPSYLSFRQIADRSDAEQGIDYKQDDHDWLETIFGVTVETAPLQDVGEILCSEGRLITFPNTLQHRVNPFKLENPKKPGHRKIVALFLVDPHLKIISTANVPPQRHDWWAEMVLREKPLVDLPPELRYGVTDHAKDWLMGLEEAEALRLELMEMRRAYIGKCEGAVHDLYISLCEH